MKSRENARAEHETRRAAWSEKRVEAESLSRAVDRFRKEEQHVADRREQREGDDAALRVSFATRGEAGRHRADRTCPRRAPLLVAFDPAFYLSRPSTAPT